MYEQTKSLDLISSTISAGSIFDRNSMEALMRCIDTLSPLTNGRTDRVVQLATAIGNQVRLENPDLEELKVAVLFCDIGMWAISDDIIHKKGRLTLDEFKMVQQHPEYSLNALDEISLGEKTKKAILCQHEKYDGSGYPNRLMGNDIPFLAQIVNVACTLYGITAERSYRDAIPVEKAIEIIRNETKQQFHPDIVRAVMELHSKGVIEKILIKPVKDPFKRKMHEAKDTTQYIKEKKHLSDFDHSDKSHIKVEERLNSLREIIEDSSIE
ncbi:MAG: HD domain-containing phosphohydrolase [bacterium]